MPKVTLFKDLVDRHFDMAAAQSKKCLQQIHFKVNPNDVPWMYWEPRMAKNLGRSARVYHKLFRLTNLE